MTTVSDPDPNVEIEFEEGGDNVFADIGFDEASAIRLHHKATLVGVLRRYQETHCLTQVELGMIANIPQPKISALYRGKIAGITTEKLLEAVIRIGAHISIRVDANPGRDQAGTIDMVVA